MSPFDRRVTTKVTTVSGDWDRSDAMKPKMRIVPIVQLVPCSRSSHGESLEKNGAGRSVVLDRRDRVIARNKTVEAARADGMKSAQLEEGTKRQSVGEAKE